MLNPTDLLAVVIRLVVVIGNAASAGSGGVEHVIMGLDKCPANIAARACEL